MGPWRHLGWSPDISNTDVELYLKEISRYRLLKIEEERELARRIRQGDQEARNQMVRANLRLVVSIAKNYSERGLSLLDLIEEGNIGLLKAVERFNPDEGCKFSTYASWWIKQTVRRALINKVKNVRVPAYMVELLTRWRRATETLTQSLGRAPTPDEIASEIGLSGDKLLALFRALIAQGPGFRGESGSYVQDLIEEVPATGNGSSDFVDETNGWALDSILANVLSEREQLIIRMRFGLIDGDKDLDMASGETATLDQIGTRIGLTRERIRQIEAQALQKLFGYLSGSEVQSEPQSRRSTRKSGRSSSKSARNRPN